MKQSFYIGRKPKKNLGKGTDLSKVTGALLVFSTVQVVMVLFLLFSGAFVYGSIFGVLLVTTGFIGGILDIFLTRELRKKQDELEDAVETIHDLEDLNINLRAQRHDFKNHVQIISALLELDEFEEAKDYMARVNIDMQMLGGAFKTSKPAVNALLQAKRLICDQKGILFEINITSRLDRIPIESWEICRILGNIIDNAVEAMENAKTSLPKLIVKLYENETDICMSVANNGPAIPDKIKESIFDPEFSTKGRERGLGLAIVEEILDDCGGSITLESNDDETVFDIHLPKIECVEQQTFPKVG